MAKSSFSNGECSISSDYIAMLVDHGSELGISPATLLSGSNIPLNALINRDVRVSGRSIDCVMHNFLKLREENLSIIHGKRMTIATHGMLGLATQTSDTLMDAANAISQYIQTRSLTSDRIEILTDSDWTQVRLHSNDPLLSVETTKFHVVTTLIAIEYASRWLLTPSNKTVVSELRLTFPPMFTDFQSLLPDNFSIHFNQRYNELVWPTHLMTTPLLSSNPSMKDVAVQGCENQLLKLAPDIGIALALRSILRNTGSLSINADNAARQLNMSVSTLKRKLKEENTSFQKIKDSERFNLSVELLSNTKKNLEDIADILGYNNSSNFIKAFKGWCDQSPNEYRKNLDNFSA